MRKRPIAVDLFAGVGGLSLGFEQAGFDVRTAVEIDPIHAACHAYNFPECVVLPNSVSHLNGANIRENGGLGDEIIDVVCGGAPCQGFSIIGKRAIDDPRNALVKDFIRLVCELKARAFVFENVKGLTQGKHRKFLDELITEFERAGYEITNPIKVLNAANFAVPQSRDRLFLIGVKKGEKLPIYPINATSNPNMKIETDFPSAPNVMDAIGDLPDAETFEKLKHNDSVETDKFGEPSEYAAELRCLTNSAWHFGHPRKWVPNVLTSSMRTEHTDISRRRFESTTYGKVEPISRLFKLDPAGISNTLRAGTDASRGAFTSPRPIHPIHARCITVREMARLHGFPDWFRFHKTKWHGARQIGNAVPPPLAKAVATQVLYALGFVPEVSFKQQDLGDEKLLHMDLTEASKYWDVANPIARRDRKSGYKKRKQIEIEAHSKQNSEKVN